MSTPIRVYYCADMDAPTAQISPSAQKPQRAVESWGRLGIPLDIKRTTPISEETLGYAHDPNYVKGVLTGTRDNGFGNRDPGVARSLLFTNGSFCLAAHHELRTRRVAVSPSCGFHHAHYAEAGAYCTFNGLMVAACWLQRKGLIERRVGILDLDMHYGNGTDEIIGRFPERERPKHFSAGREFRSRTQVDAFFQVLAEKLDWMSDCDVIFYQAGADPHVRDPLGGWMTTEQLAQRDRTVFEACQRMNVGVAWNLAGGYQTNLDGSTNWPAILEIHDNTMKACWEVFGDS